MVAKEFPRLGLGMAALGRPGYINLDRNAVFGSGERNLETMRSQAYQVLDKLFSSSPEKGVWVDCARSYGVSEMFVGEYLREHKVDPNSVYVSSKWGYTYVADFKVSLAPGASHEIKDHSTENFLKQVKETEEYLGEYVDLYQIHSATFESGILTDSTAHKALADCKKKRGWKLGLSVSSPLQSDVIREARKVQVDGVPLFDSVQCTFNVLEQRPRDALQEAHDAGLDIIVKEGLANGRVLKNPAVLDYATKLSCEPDQLALGCILAQNFSPHVLSGAVTADQLGSNLKAEEISTLLKEDTILLNKIMESCVVKSEDYWSERASLDWN